jgi:hypothetical protein
MKRLVCATLALTLMGTAAASAHSDDQGGYDSGYSHSDRRGGNDNTGALIGLGIGLFALGAIVAASHNNDRDRYYQNNYAPAYQGGYYQNRGGYQNGYRGNYQSYRGNGYNYGNRYGNGYDNR